MEIFETKSRYHVNGNAGFAGVFSNMSITLTIILILIVLLVWGCITCMHMSWEATAKKNFIKQMRDYGFVIEAFDVKLIDNLDAGSGQEVLRLVFSVQHLKQPELNDGHDCGYTTATVTTRSYGGAELNVENIALRNSSLDLTIDNWVTWVYGKKHPSQ